MPAKVRRRKRLPGAHPTLAGAAIRPSSWSSTSSTPAEILRNCVKKVDLPHYVFADFRDGLWVGVNYTDQTYRLPTSKRTDFLVGDRYLEPGGVTVWKD